MEIKHIIKRDDSKESFDANKITEAIFKATKGIEKVLPGYIGGNTSNPTYKDICTGLTGHAEVISVDYDLKKINLENILEIFFSTHDPTTINRQGNDIGTQYRSTILYSDKNQKETIQATKSIFQELLTSADYGQIVTIVKMLEEFYVAEDYHQDYIAKNPNGYCPDHSTGIKFSPNNQIAKLDNALIQQGKQIVVIEPQGFCPYCEKFKEDVSNNYKGTIPMSFRLASNLEGLNIKTPTWATPTILFFEDGEEVFGYQGYLEPKEFYKVLGAFKLGRSEAYNVAFNEGTDARFCKEYEIFKNTPDGVFVDKLSGAHLFDTRDRFNSTSGWLSFTSPVAGSVYELEDNSYGMRRTEIRSSSSGIHLGHVFDDGPNGMPRYCINATVLEFVLRKDI